MNAADLKSLLYTYLAILRSPGGAEKIGFAIEAHIEVLNKLESYGNIVYLRDLPSYRESMARGEYRELAPVVDPTELLLPHGWEEGHQTL